MNAWDKRLCDLEKAVAGLKSQVGWLTHASGTSTWTPTVGGAPVGVVPAAEKTEHQPFAPGDRVRVVASTTRSGMSGTLPECVRRGETATVKNVKPVDGSPCCWVQFDDGVWDWCWPHNLALVPPPTFAPRHFSGNQWSAVVGINTDGDRVLLKAYDKDTQVTIAMSGHSARQIAEALVAAAEACIAEEEGGA